jgi:hypothetical protein
MKYLFFFLLNAFAFSGCKKSNNFGNDTLPPITQEGRNSFGCLINGKLYVPKGFEQNHPSFDMIVDPTFNDGSIDIKVFNKNGDLTTRLNFGSDSISNVGLFILNTRVDFSYSIYSKSLSDNVCETPYSYGSSSNKSGFIKITKYDLINGIFSGEFEFHFVNPDCGLGDTIDITLGRFDKKLN